jgi:hypothetical protein
MLHSTTISAAQLKETLQQEQVVVEEKKAATEKLLEQLSVARAKAEEQVLQNSNNVGRKCNISLHREN